MNGNCCYFLILSYLSKRIIFIAISFKQRICTSGCIQIIYFGSSFKIKDLYDQLRIDNLYFVIFTFSLFKLQNLLNKHCALWYALKQRINYAAAYKPFTLGYLKIKVLYNQLRIDNLYLLNITKPSTQLLDQSINRL